MALGFGLGVLPPPSAGDFATIPPQTKTLQLKSPSGPKTLKYLALKGSNFFRRFLHRKRSLYSYTFASYCSFVNTFIRKKLMFHPYVLKFRILMPFYQHIFLTALIFQFGILQVLPGVFIFRL